MIEVPVWLKVYQVEGLEKKLSTLKQFQKPESLELKKRDNIDSLKLASERSEEETRNKNNPRISKVGKFNNFSI